MRQVLVPSHGDKEQGEWGRAAAGGQGGGPERGAGGPLWSVQHHGEAGRVGRQPSGPAAPSRPVKVEVRPGVLHEVQLGRAPAARPRSAPHAPRPQGAPPPAAAPPRQQSARPAAQARPGAGPQPVGGRGAAAWGAEGGRGRAPSPSPRAPAPPSAPGPVAAAVPVLEAAMRAALRARAQLHLPQRTVLLRACAKVLGKQEVELVEGDKMSSAQFMAAWAALGVQVSPDLARAMFIKYGQDVRGAMPVSVFVESLLYGAPRQLMLDNDTVQRGAYPAGRPALHRGKIQYPECKKGVWPPSDWEPQLAQRSALLPDCRLALDWVHGYDGFQATAPNLFITGSGEVVYPAAAVAIVYSRDTHTQRFYLAHDDDILSLALHPDKTTVATGQVGRDPLVLVWDSRDCRTLQRLPQGPGNRGVQALAWAPSGLHLAAVCTDNSHTLYIWDWQRAQCVFEAKTMPGAPPSTYGLTWSPFQPDRLVAYGLNFIKFFTLQRGTEGGARSWTAKQDAGVYAASRTFTVFSALFLPNGTLITGNAAGELGSWQGSRLLALTPGHGPGPNTRRPDGTPSPGGVRCLLLPDPTCLISGGSDGFIIRWAVGAAGLGPQLQRIPVMRPDQAGVVAPPPLRALDQVPGGDTLVAGTAGCEVWEVGPSPRVLLAGQQAPLWALAMNPAWPHVYATAGDSDTVVVWSAATRKPLKVLQLAGARDAARCCAFSPDGQHLAVGLVSGGLKVLEFHPSLAQVFWGKLFAESLDVLKYSPCGRYLAAASRDQSLEVLDVKGGYRRLSRCVGHSSTITHLDWAADSAVIQSNDQAYEILYFDPRSGRQVGGCQRDTRWATWSCVLGFPVMGIWPPDSDGSDINSADRSPSGRYLLTADDLGKVNLFNFPCVVKHAPALRYGGHSSHVMCVRWAADESFAVSVGGRDRCVFQWRLVPSSTPPSTFFGHQPLAPVGADGIVFRVPEASPAAKVSNVKGRSGPAPAAQDRKQLGTPARPSRGR
ncbi:WD40-repeat-containing domain protein [Haematococcus lacustris]